MLDKAVEGSGNSFTKRTYTQKFSQSSQQHSTKLKSMDIKREERKEEKIIQFFYFWGEIYGILQNRYTHGQMCENRAKSIIVTPL